MELESVDAAEGQRVEFKCEADGIPTPVHFWYINGVPIASKLNCCLVLSSYNISICRFVDFFYISICD